MNCRLCFLALALAAVALHAAAFEARVTRVIDGDTLDVEASGGTQRVRLADIDAPERAQPFGRVCGRNLARLAEGRTVSVRPVAGRPIDRHGRIVAYVELDSVDLNLRQIETGCAWHAIEYAQGHQSREDFARYAAAQLRARRDRAGLWIDGDPVYPAFYRKAQR